MKNYLIYRDDKKYCSFPSVCIDEEDGSIYCVFRAEDKKTSPTHINTQSYAMLMRSSDYGETWEFVSKIKSHLPRSGIQDPTIAYNPFGRYMIMTYCVWETEKRKSRKQEDTRMLGVFLSKSDDGGKTWSDLQHLPGLFRQQLASRCPVVFLDAWSDLGWGLVGHGDTGGGGLTSFFTMCSDAGNYWHDLTKVAQDSSGMVGYTEPWLVDAKYGHLVCLVRAEAEGNSTYQVHSWDSGDTWETPRKTPIKGFPASLVRLEDGRLLATYGVRSNPYGIRACFSRDNGINWDAGNEVNLRLDGGSWDIGYPQTIQLPDKSLLTVYYFHTKEDSIRHIQCTRWEL